MCKHGLLSASWWGHTAGFRVNDQLMSELKQQVPPNIRLNSPVELIVVITSLQPEVRPDEEKKKCTAEEKEPWTFPLKNKNRMWCKHTSSRQTFIHLADAFIPMRNVTNLTDASNQQSASVLIRLHFLFICSKFGLLIALFISFTTVSNVAGDVRSCWDQIHSF